VSRGAGLSITRLEGPLQLRIGPLTIASCEVVGIAGLAGAGVEELFAMLFGRLRPRHAELRLPDGRGVPRSANEAVRRGIAYIPADRKRIGLQLQKSIAENVASVRALVQRKDGFILNQARLEQLSAARCRQLGVKAPSVQQVVGALSGGNQQKVVFAKWLEADPSVLLFDDPTRGVDVGAKREMHAVIRSLAQSGRLVLVYSSDPLELVTLADRVHVFVDGRLTQELSGAGLSEHNLVAAMNARPGAAKPSDDVAA
jgi:ABC-type sugar transport system ATPase subunit